jgi:diamine N-acetyltransferase
MIELRPVTIQNWEALIKLKVREDQQGFVASNLYSIAQAQFGEEFEGHWDLHPFGIYQDEEPVGFLMYALKFDYPAYEAFIIRQMVDEKQQGQGYGRAGMEKVLEIFRADERIHAVGISYEPHNEGARKLYASLGFVETGRIVDEETEAVLKLKP